MKQVAQSCGISCIAGMLLSLFAVQAGAGALECATSQPVDLVVRVDEKEPARTLRLVGGQSPALRLQDPQTGALRWSAAATAPATQIFPDMWAGFAGSLTPVDLDGDGLHDRIYGGDLAGRVWRFDIHHGAGADALLTGGVFASLGGVPAVRAFLAAPDISLSSSAGASWLNIAIGTASLGAGVSNRFYVLRDRAPMQSWSAEDYARWRPITEADLLRLDDERSTEAGMQTPADAAAGFYLVTGSGSVLSASITVSGHAVIAIAHEISGTGSQCSIAVTIASLSLLDGRPDLDLNADGDINAADRMVQLPQRVPATTRFAMVMDREKAAAECRFGPAVIPGCSLSMQLTPVWWRREDAD
jgi:hypothetical protein